MSKILGFMLLVSVGFEASASRKIIYGEDNRSDITTTSLKTVKNFATGIAGRVKNYRVEKNDKLFTLLNVRNLSHPTKARLCKDEQFANQPSTTDCTGFLIAEDLFVTAGHCATELDTIAEDEKTPECSTHSWMFDYSTDLNGKISLKNVDAKKLVGCKKVIYAEFSSKVDFAIIQLDRKLPGRHFFELDANPIQENDDIFVMGHPSGLPLKIATDAKVFSTHDNYFSTNLDTFGGNSGSPVFNTRTSEVVGVLSRGDIDYVMDEYEGESCRRVNRCDSSRENCIEDHPGIDGEHVTHIELVKERLKRLKHL